MRNFLRYLFAKSRHEKLPHLQNHLTAGYHLDDLDAEAHLLMLAGIVKDPAAARRLLEENGGITASEYLTKMPRRRVDVRARLRRWIQSVEGSSATDPHTDEYKQLQREYGEIL